MNAKSAIALTAALLTTAPLAGCDSLSDFIDIFSGKKSAAQQRHEAAARVEAVYVVPPPAAPESPPEAEQPLIVAEAPLPVVVPDPGPPPFECVTIWRTQTCDAGVLYMLDSNGNWILPGRTE